LSLIVDVRVPAFVSLKIDDDHHHSSAAAPLIIIPSTNSSYLIMIIKYLHMLTHD
jgi:hypothetical protein